MIFKILLTVFNQSYNCQTSHCLGRNLLPKPLLSLPSLTYLSVRSLTSTWIMADDCDRFKTVWKLPGLLRSLKIMLFTLVTCFKCISYLSLLSHQILRALGLNKYVISKFGILFRKKFWAISYYEGPFVHFWYPSRRNFYNALVVVIDCWVVGGQLFSALECVIKVKSREKRY